MATADRTDNIGSASKVPEEVAVQVKTRGQALQLHVYQGSATHRKFQDLAATLNKDQAEPSS